MKVLLLAALPLLTWGQNDDLFTYKESDLDARIYGPRDWENVACDDLENCVSALSTTIGTNETYPHPCFSTNRRDGLRNG